MLVCVDTLVSYTFACACACACVDSGALIEAAVTGVISSVEKALSVLQYIEASVR